MKHRIVKLKPNDLLVDPYVQRSLDHKRARKLAADFDPAAVGVLTISQREDGMYVVDGQHRAEAARIAGRGATPIDCNVYSDLTKAQEAQLFVKLHISLKPSAAERFRIRLVAHEPAVVEIDAILSEHGWTTGRSNSNGVTPAVAALEKAHASGQLDRAMRVIAETWGTEREAGLAPIIGGVPAFLALWGEQVDDKSLVASLRKIRPDALIRMADAYRMSPGATYATAMPQAIVELYNKGKKGARRIDPFG